jgi:nucleoside-diphosphate-sugar epimerase
MQTLPLVVTGAKGYVGQRLVKELEKRKFQVLEVDLIGQRAFDLSKPDTAERLSGYLPDDFDLIHLAFPFPGTMGSKRMTRLVKSVNDSLLSLKPRPRRTLFISSTAVYSADSALEDSPWEVYGSLKRQSEVQLARLGNLSILRPGTLVDGTRRSAIATLYLRAISGKSALLPKNGSLAHPFLHVDDLVGACVSWSEMDETQCFNYDLWAAEPISAREYLQARGINSKIVNLPKFVQRVFGSDSLPLLGISKWHFRALNYDVSGKMSGGSRLQPLKKMSQIFDELLSSES